MRAVITGGAGFLGSHLAEWLIADGHAVVCVDDYSTGSRSNLAGFDDSARLEVLEADITDGLIVEGDVDAVLHFASPASPIDYLRRPVETLRVGSVGTLNALELARSKGARFLLASTSEVYGDPLVHPQPEAYWGNVNPVGPRAVYDEGKRFGESAVVTYRDVYGLDAKIVRIFNTFGPRMRPADGRAVPTFIRQALDGEPITVSGDGSQTRSLCYVDDLVDGVLRMLRSDEPGPINLGNPHEISMLDLATWIRDLVGSPSQIMLIPRPTDDPENRRPDVSRAAERLGWSARVAVEDGLKATIAHFRDL